MTDVSKIVGPQLQHPGPKSLRLRPTTSQDGDALPARVMGRVRLFSAEIAKTLTTQHYELPQVQDERAGGWRVVPRRGLLPITVWDGSPPLRLKLVMMLDGYAREPRTDIVDELSDLRLLGYHNKELGRPPTLRVIGAVPYSDAGVLDSSTSPPDWVIESLQVEEQLHIAGRCARAKATLTLLEYIPSNVTLRAAQGAPRHSYQWKKGDTLARVAQAQLGDTRKASLIAAANPKVKHWTKVAAGSSITIPRVTA